MLFLADGLAWDDLYGGSGAIPEPFRDRAAWGLVAVAPGDPADPWTRQLSLGWGRRTPFPREAPVPAARPEATLEKGVPAQALWSTLRGQPAPDRAGLLLFLPPEPTGPGNLGDALRRAGVSVVLIGGGLEAAEAPPAAALLAGSDGLFLGAALPEPLEADPEWPGLNRTDWDRLDQIAQGAWDADLLVIQWGDLDRLQRWEALLPADRYLALRQEALSKALGWMATASGRLPEGGKLLLLSPAPPRSQPARAPAPLFLFPHEGPGLVTSGSTRRPGLLDPGDVAPSILALLGADGEWPGVGRPMVLRASEDPERTLDRFYRTALGVSELRRPVLHTYIILFAGMVLLAAILFAAAPDGLATRRLSPVLDFGILMAAAAPLGMLLPPLFTSDGRIHLALLLLFSTLIAWLLTARVPAPGRFPVLAAATFAALATDTVLGANLQLHAFLGNDPLGGARYYGVGNEYMGVFLGSGLITAGALWQWRPGARWAGLAVLALLVVTLGHPRLGANVGGATAALFGSAYLLLRLRTRPPRWFELVLAGAGTLAVLAAAGLYEAWTAPPETRSHLGQLVARMLREGWAPLAETALRKAATNMRLVEYTVWSRVLIATLVAFVILLYRPVGLFRQLLARSPFLTRGLEAALVAALTALAANDSGVLAAATAMILTMSTLLAALRETQRVSP